MESNERGGALSIAAGSALITFPNTWRLDSRSEDGIVVRSGNGREQATISVIPFKKPVSFDEFCQVCHYRVEAEMKGLKEGFIHPNPPVPREASDGFRLFYTGGDKSTHRVFSVFVLQIESEVLTVYLEGLGIPLTEHSATFRAVLSTLKRRKRTGQASQQD